MDIKNKLIIPKATDLLDLRSITPPPIYNGYGHLPNTQIQTKGESEQSLIMKYSLLANSSSLNLSKSNCYDLNLQLHSNSVSNPYTFTITGNKSFSGNCVASKVNGNYTIYSGTSSYNGTTYIGYCADKYGSFKDNFKIYNGADITALYLIIPANSTSPTDYMVYAEFVNNPGTISGMNLNQAVFKTDIQDNTDSVYSWIGYFSSGFIDENISTVISVLIY